MKTCYLQFTKIYKQKELTGKKRKEQSYVVAPKNSCSGNFEEVLQTIRLHRRQPSRAVYKKRCSENMQQIYRRTLMPKCDFNKVALQSY